MRETPVTDWVTYFKNTNRNIFNQCFSNRRLIEVIIQNTPKGGQILEAGCGTALLGLILADYGFKVTALDLTEDVLNYARSRVCLNQLDLNFVKGNIFELSSVFDKKYFDVVCHSGVMEHFSDNDVVKSLSEQRLVSRMVIFNIPNGRNKITPQHFGDERFFSNKKWMSLIREAGFNKVKVLGGYDLPKFLYFILPGVFFHRKVSFWWKWASRHSIFICE